MAEIMLTEHNFLVSTTDKKGIIIFANEDFVRSQGIRSRIL